MSRQSPTGFVFSMVVEIAAVVVIVSFLPRVDLRPAATAAADAGYARASYSQSTITEPTISRTGWTTPDRASPASPARETSFYERRAVQSALASQPSPPRAEAPPLIEDDSARPQYVEQRLDRASQQLVNSVGSYVAQAAGDVLSYPSRASAPAPSTVGSSPLALAPQPNSSVAMGQGSIAPVPSAASSRPARGSFATQPRPWIRY